MGQSLGSLLRQLAARRGTAATLAVLEMAAIFFLSHRSWKGSGAGLPEGVSNLCHFPLYGVLGALFAVALGVGQSVGLALTRRAALAGACLAVIYGFVDEIHQGFVPGRDCSFYDILTNTAAAFTGALTLHAALGAQRLAWSWLLIGLLLSVVTSFWLPSAFPDLNGLLQSAFFG